MLQSTRVILHSEHGSQNTSQKFRQTCTVAKSKLFKVNVYDLFDNAMVKKNLFGKLKIEIIDRQPLPLFRISSDDSHEVFVATRGVLLPTPSAIDIGLSVSGSL